MMDNGRQIQFSYLLNRRRFFWAVGMTICMIMLIQSFTIPYRFVLHSLAPAFDASQHRHELIVNDNPSRTFAYVDQVQLVSGIKHTDSSTMTILDDETTTFDEEGNIIHVDGRKERQQNGMTVEAEDDIEFDVDEDEDSEVDDSSDMVTSNYLEKTISDENGILYLNSSQFFNLTIPTDNNDSVQPKTATTIIPTSASDKLTRKTSSTIPNMYLQYNTSSSWSTYLKLRKKRSIAIFEMKKLLLQNQISAHSVV